MVNRSCEKVKRAIKLRRMNADVMRGEEAGHGEIERYRGLVTKED